MGSICLDFLVLDVTQKPRAWANFMAGQLYFISPEVVATAARLLGTITRCSRCQMYDDCIVLHDCVLVIW